ncbi:hypothetical protein [Methanolobus vulcani]|uniref:Uncharacterized protein n=1 Tax=Methanolobus vulcani TaxID=38026 RepID=A0A7Z8P1F3_9EURY|nr:hypothetical protein [Methanolobus vulcani]TQD24196.1 hypothetical protein FKV42_11220 [Methanolobus vulcani]
MNAGLLLNATICFAITLSSFAFAWVLARSEEEHTDKSKPALWSLVILWSLVGLTYLPTTIRMIAAYMGRENLDLMMYNLAAVPFSFVAVPLVFFILYVIAGNKKISAYISLLFALFGVSYLMLLFTNGVIGPIVSDYSSLFTINSDIAINIYLIGLFVIPTAMIIGFLLLIFLQKMPKHLRYRTALPLVAISFVFDFMLTDMITMVDVMQLVARLFVLIGTVQAFLAYFPPMTLQEKLGIKKYQYELYDDEDFDIEEEDDIDV